MMSQEPSHATSSMAKYESQFVSCGQSGEVEGLHSSRWESLMMGNESDRGCCLQPDKRADLHSSSGSNRFIYPLLSHPHLCRLPLVAPNDCLDAGKGAGELLGRSPRHREHNVERDVQLQRVARDNGGASEGPNVNICKKLKHDGLTA